MLRFAKKYIKDAEGAAASDLSVSVSGGSVVFRNFELNLEGECFQEVLRAAMIGAKCPASN